MKFRFDSYILDLGSHELSLDDIVVPCEPQVFDLLSYLIKNADRLVTQDDLIDAVWGGRIVSDSAISARISAARSAIGDSGKLQKYIKTVPRRGFKFSGDFIVESDAGINSSVEPNKSGPGSEFLYLEQIPVNQKVHFCRSRDGARIAYATTGQGIPLVRAGHWLSHLEHDWQSPVWRPFLNELGKTFSVTRYDQRGNGLSDWRVDDFSLDAFVDDLEAVIESAGLDQFSLYGTSQGAPIAISYAVRHPKRVKHLILHGGYVHGRLTRGAVEEREQGLALLTLVRHGWGKSGSAFLSSFASMYIPGATKEQLGSLADLQRLTTSPENAAKLREAVDRFDVTELLEKVKAPTLIIHADNDGVQPLDQGRALAAGIKGSQFILLESVNHVILEHEPAWQKLFVELRNFISDN